MGANKQGETGWKVELVFVCTGQDEMGEGGWEGDRVLEVGAEVQKDKVRRHGKLALEPGAQFEVGDGRRDLGWFVVPQAQDQVGEGGWEFLNGTVVAITQGEVGEGGGERWHQRGSERITSAAARSERQVCQRRWVGRQRPLPWAALEVSEGRREAWGEVRTHVHGSVGVGVVKRGGALEVGDVGVRGHLGCDSVHATPPLRLMLHEFKRRWLPVITS